MGTDSSAKGAPFARSGFADSGNLTLSWRGALVDSKADPVLSGEMSTVSKPVFPVTGADTDSCDCSSDIAVMSCHTKLQLHFGQIPICRDWNPTSRLLQ